MPYKDPALRRAAVKRHYDSHKEYYRERNRIARNRKAEYIQKLREVPCMDCRQEYPYYVMEFDHRENKILPIARMISHSWKRLKAEIAKCDVVCANCHSIRTHLRRTAGEKANAVGLNPTVQ